MNKADRILDLKKQYDGGHISKTEFENLKIKTLYGHNTKEEMKDDSEPLEPKIQEQPVEIKSIEKEITIPVTSKIPVEKKESQAIPEYENSNKIYYIVFGIIILLIGLFVFYKIAFAGPSIEQINAMEKAKQDSIASAQLLADKKLEDSLDNAGYESEMDSNQDETTSIENMNEISTKIYKYYEDIQLGRIDAIDYFAPIVSQYITKNNLTPEDINNSISKGKEEFSKPEIVLDINNIVNTRTENEIRYYGFKIHFKCYRTSKQKTQECDVTVEIGVNQSNEFVSIKETNIENLIFYDEKESSSSINSANKVINFASINHEGSNISEFLTCTFDSRNIPEKIIYYSTSKRKNIELNIISGSNNACKVTFPNNSETFRLLFKDDQVICIDENNKEQYFYLID